MLINFRQIDIDEAFTYSGRHFVKKSHTEAYMLPNREVKTFFEYLPVEPEDTIVYKNSSESSSG